MPVAQLVAQILLTYGPAIAKEWVVIFHHQDPQKADFLALLDKISQEDYDTIIAERRAARGLAPAPKP